MPFYPSNWTKDSLVFILQAPLNPPPFVLWFSSSPRIWHFTTLHILQLLPIYYTQTFQKNRRGDEDVIIHEDSENDHEAVIIHEDSENVWEAFHANVKFTARCALFL